MEPLANNKRAGETCCENNYGALNSKADYLENGLLCGMRTRFWEKSLFTVEDGKTYSLRSKRENGANISIRRRTTQNSLHAQSLCTGIYSPFISIFI
jgi:hypothetical protein